jgi:Tfp pilus assembly protein PilO
MNRSASLTALVLFIVSILVGVFFWQPMRDRVVEQSTLLDSEQAELTILEKQVADLVSLEANLPVSDTERERILDTVPTQLAQDDLVKDLSTLADKVGISLNSMTFSLHPASPTLTVGAAAAKSGEADVVSIMANFTGNYDDLITLLKALESNKRLFRVTSIGVQLSEITEQGQQMIFTVALEAYYQNSL